MSRRLDSSFIFTWLLVLGSSLFVPMGISSSLAQVNPVPAPNPPETEIKVGAYVFPGWYNGRGDSNGEWKLIAKFAHPRPVLGFYDDSMPEVNDWQLKWALDAGISWLAFDWYWVNGNKFYEKSLEDGFLKAEYNPLMKFCVHWCNHPVGGWGDHDFSPPALVTTLQYCVDNYFKLPNYLKIGDRPVFMIWDIDVILAANGGEYGFNSIVLPQLNQVCRNAGLGDLYIVLVNNNPRFVGSKGVGDAFTGYSYAGFTTKSCWSSPGSAPYAEQVEAMPAMWDELHKQTKPFLTSMSSGWDDMPRTIGWGNETRWVRTENSVALFEQSLREGKARVRPEFPYFLIEALNEWGEGSCIEPNKEFGFGQYEAVHRVFAKAGSVMPVWPSPSQVQIDSYSVLTGDVLAAARARELQPDPAPAVSPTARYLQKDPEHMPNAIQNEFTFTGTPPWESVIVNGALGVSQPAGSSTVFEVVGNDPQLYMYGDWGAFTEGIAVGVQYRYTTPNPTLLQRAELFWQTSENPFSQTSSGCFVFEPDGETHQLLLTFPKDYNLSGSMNGFRIDPPDVMGSKLEIDWVRIYTVGSLNGVTTY